MAIPIRSVSASLAARDRVSAPACPACGRVVDFLSFAQNPAVPPENFATK